VRFYETEAKRLFAKRGIPVPRGGSAATPAEAAKIAAEIGGAVAVKAQVLGRGRGKANLVRFAATADEAARQAAELLGLEVAGRKPLAVLVEQKLEPVAVYAVAASYDGVQKRPVLVASDRGGRDLDETAEREPERYFTRHFSALGPPPDYCAKELAKALSLGGQDLVKMAGVVARLGRLLLDCDLTRAEIGSLARLADGQLVALDAHLDLEVEARSRQKALLDELGVAPGDTRAPRDPTPFEIAAARIDKEDPRGVAGPVVEFDGNIGLVIGAGGGSLTTFDAIRKHGGRPANYAALGGNPSVKKTEQLTRLVLQKPGVEKIAVISNVVSNTRADLVARGVIKGVLSLGLVPAEKITVFRVPGAWEADAQKILAKYGVELCDRTVSISEAARRAVEKFGRAG
jgi:succinyl-CoA synthetase beta subunit/citryl-CoA synthetase large subunit